MIPLLIAVAAAVGMADSGSDSEQLNTPAEMPPVVQAEHSQQADPMTAQGEMFKEMPQAALQAKPTMTPAAPVLYVEESPREEMLGLVGESSSPAPQVQWKLDISDQRLDIALSRWAEKAGYALRWDAERYVLIGAPSVFTGSFKQALNQVLQSPGVKYSEYPLEACIYANNPPLVRITKLGDQTQECR